MVRVAVRAVFSLCLCGWIPACWAQIPSSVPQTPAEQAKFYEAQLKLRPDWAEGWFNYAGSLYQLNNFAAARDGFRRAAALAPGNGAVMAFLGLSEDKLANFGAALADLQRGETLGLPDNGAFVSEVYGAGARICLRSDDFSAALAQLQPLIKLGLKSPASMEELGITTLALKLPSGEVPESERAVVEMAGQAAWALYGNDPNGAARLCKQLAAAFPQTPGVHYLNGIRLITSDHAAARNEFLQELRVDPSRTDARLQIAILDVKLGKPQEAVQYAREALAADGRNVLAQIVLGKALLDMGRAPEAEVQFEAAEKLAPEKPEIHAYLAKTYQRAGNLEASHREQAEFYRLKAKETTTSVSLDSAPQ